MKDLKDHMNENLNIQESRIRPTDIEHYISSWMYEPLNKKEMKDYIEAIRDGIRNAISERNNYQTDPKAMDATEYLGQIEDAISKVI